MFTGYIKLAIGSIVFLGVCLGAAGKEGLRKLTDKIDCVIAKSESATPAKPSLATASDEELHQKLKEALATTKRQHTDMAVRVRIVESKRAEMEDKKVGLDTKIAAERPLLERAVGILQEGRATYTLGAGTFTRETVAGEVRSRAQRLARLQAESEAQGQMLARLDNEIAAAHEKINEHAANIAELDRRTDEIVQRQQLAQLRKRAVELAAALHEVGEGTPEVAEPLDELTRRITQTEAEVEVLAGDGKPTEIDFGSAKDAVDEAIAEASKVLGLPASAPTKPLALLPTTQPVAVRTSDLELVRLLRDALGVPASQQ